MIRRTNGLVQYCFFTLLLCLSYSTLNNVAVLYLPHVSITHQCQWAATTDLSFPVFILLPQGQLSFCCPYDNVAIHIADLFFTLYISSSFCPLKRHKPFITSTITSTVTLTATTTATATVTAAAAAISGGDALKITGLVVGGVFGLGLLGVGAMWMRRRYVSPAAGEKERDGLHLLISV